MQAVDGLGGIDIEGEKVAALLAQITIIQIYVGHMLFLTEGSGVVNFEVTLWRHFWHRVGGLDS